MRGLCFFLLGALLLIIQTSFFPFLPGWIGKPDLLFILVIFLALRMKIFQGGVLTLLLGLLMDIFSGIYLGLYPMTYLILFFSIQWAVKHLFVGEISHQIPLVVVSYLFMSSGVFIGSSMLEPKGLLHWSWPDIFLQMLMLAIMTMPLFYMFDKVMGFFKKRQVRWTLVGSRSKNRFTTPERGRRT